MLAQQTEYKFEIVIHDDCSTDKTRAILVEYQQQFPNIIKLVLQETNQYSLGKRIIPLAVAASDIIISSLKRRYVSIWG